MATETQQPLPFWEEKISIEPDLGDQRRSTSKALPSPPKTPKRVMMKYRFSGVFPLVLSLAAFVLTLVMVLAGGNVTTFEGQYLVALNTSRLGQDIGIWEKASGRPTASSVPSSTPLSTSEGVTNQTDVRDLHYVYLGNICSVSLARRNGGNAGNVEVDDCRSWEEVRDSISTLSSRISSSVVVGQTQVAMPLLAKLTSSLDSMLDMLGVVRRAMFAFLIVSLVGSIMSAISVLPAMYFPHSRLLIYLNTFWSGLAVVSAFVAAILLSAMMVLAGTMEGFSDAVGVKMKRGGIVLLFVWLSWLFVSLVTVYWTSVWFVETRKWSFVKRRRDEDEIGHWRGIGREVCRDLRGRRRKVRVRGDI